MSTRIPNEERINLLQGTLDLLILRILLFGQEHGQGIARAIQSMSGDELLVDHGSLYPAVQRLEKKGWISGEWGTSDNNRKARFYRLTPAGKLQFASETREWERVAAAVGRVLAAENPAG
jgi:transcriptional regulator